VLSLAVIMGKQQEAQKSTNCEACIYAQTAERMYYDMPNIVTV
jgi:hypothetical protein